MRILSRRRLKEFWGLNPQAETRLASWYRVAKSKSWQSLVEVREDFPHADAAGGFTVFNIGGNDFRLVTDVVCRVQTIYVKGVYTHAEYDRLRLE